MGCRGNAGKFPGLDSLVQRTTMPLKHVSSIAKGFLEQLRRHLLAGLHS